MTKKRALQLFILFVFVGLMAGSQVLAVSLKLQVGLPGFGNANSTVNIANDTIGKYILSVYTFSVYAAGVLAGIILAVGGFLWLTSAGNTTQIERAKSYINGALSGYVLLLVSWVLLNTINPALVTFKPLDQIMNIGHVGIPVIDQETYCCLCNSTANATTCTDAPATILGDCTCPNNVQKKTISQAECQTIDPSCTFASYGETERQQAALSICQKNNPGSTCQLNSAKGSCSNLAQCQAQLKEQKQAGYCLADVQCDTVHGYACNKAWSCAPFSQESPQQRTSIPYTLLSWPSDFAGCCLPMAREGEPCLNDGIIGDDHGDCAAGLICNARDVHYDNTPDLGVCARTSY
ncbi:MAG: hypothetical protein WC817_04555 [Patescibacteria group bacterium]|jgi:hypothetical protein